MFLLEDMLSFPGVVVPFLFFLSLDYFDQSVTEKASFSVRFEEDARADCLRPGRENEHIYADPQLPSE